MQTNLKLELEYNYCYSQPVLYIYIVYTTTKKTLQTSHNELKQMTSVVSVVLNYSLIVIATQYFVYNKTVLNKTTACKDLYNKNFITRYHTK